MATYAIGIDLGTTNSVIAYTRLDQDAAQPQVLAVPELVSQATVESRFQLPSFLYLSSEDEAATGNYDAKVVHPQNADFTGLEWSTEKPLVGRVGFFVLTF